MFTQRYRAGPPSEIQASYSELFNFFSFLLGKSKASEIDDLYSSRIDRAFQSYCFALLLLKLLCWGFRSTENPSYISRYSFKKKNSYFVLLLCRGVSSIEGYYIATYFFILFLVGWCDLIDILYVYVRVLTSPNECFMIFFSV